tara:strand:- start:891 stop:1088 length:198 start_codon:yes stop_codon:yes gene_type:complete
MAIKGSFSRCLLPADARHGSASSLLNRNWYKQLPATSWRSSKLDGIPKQLVFDLPKMFHFGFRIQ